MLVSAEELFIDATKNQYAIGAFNFYNIDTLQAIISAAEEEKAPVIVQILSSYISYLGLAPISAAALAAIRESSVPIVLHLDHANRLEDVYRAIEYGFNSVMLDVSRLSIKRNIELTKKMVNKAHPLGINTEAELGHIYRAEGLNPNKAIEGMTDYRIAARFVEQTRIDCLAPAVGSAHGTYTYEPNINFSLIEEISEKTKVYLALHGGSGIPDKMIRKAVKAGISKINVGTELKQAWVKAVKVALKDNEIEIRKILSPAREAVKKVVKKKLRLFGANNRI